MFWGTINTYTDFDRSKPWLNLKRGAAADEDELDAIELPEDLKPEYRSFQFVFSPTTHRFVYERLLGPSSARRALDRILNHVSSENEPVTVVVEQSKQGLDAILGLATLRSLTIQITRPNPDDFGAYDAEIERRLREQGASKVQIELTASEGDNGGLVPDERTLATANVALSDGSVQSKGLDDEGKAVTLRTTDHPLHVVSSFVGELTKRLFVERARSVLDKITKRDG